MEKLSNILVPSLLMILVPAVFGSEVCLPQGDLFCPVSEVPPSFQSTEIYYELPDDTKCPTGCRFPILPNIETCPNLPSARRRALTRRQFALPEECRQIYQLYADINGIHCYLTETYNRVCVERSRNGN